MQVVNIRGDKMIGVEDAVRAAVQYLESFPQLLQPRDLRLEETEYDDKGEWLITLSYAGESGGIGGIMGAVRRAKQLRIDSYSGRVLAMKNRTVV
jgi:hypothetical protein